MSLLPIADRRQSFRALSRLLLARPWTLAGALATGALGAAAALVPPWMLGRLVDDLSAGRGMAAVWTAVIAILVAGVVAALAGWWNLRLLAAVGEPAVAGLREAAVSHALAIDSAQLEAAGTGDLVSRVAEDSRQIAEATGETIPIVVQSALAVVLTMGGLLALDWRLGLAGLVGIPAYLTSLRWYLPRSGPVYQQERAAFGERAGRLLGGMEGADTLRAFGGADREIARIEESSAKARDLSIGVYFLLTRFFQRNNRAECITLVAILVTGFVLVRTDLTTAGAVTAAALLFHRMFNPIGALVTLADQVQSAGASLTRLVGVTLAPLPQPDAEAPHGEGELTVAVRIHEYLPGRPVLQQVDLELPAHRSLAVVGSTGAGKTTLAQIAAGTIEATSGTALLDGTEVRRIPRDDLRSRLCVVSQEVHTFAGSIADNLRLVRPEATDEEIGDALSVVGADGWVHRLPDGLDTVVGDGGHRLTAMQQQTLGLARVALVSPDVVVLDEATAEAGSSGARDLERAATAVLQQRTALVVAHRLSQAQRCDRIAVLEHGAVIELGSHDELTAAGGRYAQLWSAWSRR